MKILILVESLLTGGTASSLLNLLNHLKDSPIITDLYVLDNSGIESARSGELPVSVHLIKIQEIDRLNYYAKAPRNRIKLLLFSGAIWETLLRRLLKLVAGRKYNHQNDIVFRQKQDIKVARKVRKIDFSDECDCVISWCEFFLNDVLAMKISCKRKVLTSPMVLCYYTLLSNNFARE